MKLFLEQETEKDGETTISTIKEVLSKKEIVQDNSGNKLYLHTCFHDENNRKPCKREVI